MSLAGFIQRTAKAAKKTECALRKLGYGPALDHDLALLRSMGVLPGANRRR